MEKGRTEGAYTYDPPDHQMQHDAATERKLAQTEAKVLSQRRVQTMTRSSKITGIHSECSALGASTEHRSRLRPGAGLQTPEELRKTAQSIQRLVSLRRKYITLSLQRPEDDPRNAMDCEAYPHLPRCLHERPFAANMPATETV